MMQKRKMAGGYGARRLRRMRRGVWCAGVLALAWGVVAVGFACAWRGEVRRADDAEQWAAAVQAEAEAWMERVRQ